MAWREIELFVGSIGCEAWGWVAYEEPLQIEELLKWEMIYGGEVNES